MPLNRTCTIEQIKYSFNGSAIYTLSSVAAFFCNKSIEAIWGGFESLGRRLRTVSIRCRGMAAACITEKPF